MNSSIAAIISSGFGSGYAPKAPGTVGSIAAVVFWVILAECGAFPTPMWQAGAAIVVIAVGLLAANTSLEVEGGEDPQWIVIDEWAGVFVALIAADPTNLGHIFFALIGFRLFDIVKPGPVAWVEDLPGTWGVMMDDVVAGMFTLVALAAARSF